MTKDKDQATGAVGVNVPKVDGMGLMLGKPAYTDDLAPRDALIVKVLRSPHAHAEIVSMDVSRALAIPEIKCVLTYENVPEALFSRAGQGFPEPSPYDARVLSRTLRHEGDAVAVVAGTTERVVDLAMSRIRVEYKVLEPVLDFETALDHPVRVHDGDGTHSLFPIGHRPERNLAAQYEMAIGDVAAVLADCEVVYRDRYYTQPQAHAMTEPHATVAYLDVQDRLTVISSTQTPFHVRRILARSLGLPLARIRVIKPRIGGGYGGKQIIHGEFFAALVTLITKRPARLVYSRREVFESTTSRHQMRLDVAIGADRSGKIRAIDVNVLSNTGAYGEHALTVLMVAGSKTLPMYNKVEAVAFRGDVVYTHTTPAGAFRGYGAVQGNFALESAIDGLAHALGMDPVALRRKNMISEGETSKIFEVMGEGTAGTPMTIDSCKLEACIDRVMTDIGWHEKYPRVEVDAHRVRGVGLAIAMQGSGIPYIDMGAAVIKLNDSGFFNLMVGATDLGTGSDTALAQIAAEVLLVPVSQVVVYSSDTDLTPFDPGAYASSTTYVSGHSVRIAATRMRQAIIDKAKAFYSTEAVSYQDGLLQVDDRTVSLAELSTTITYSHGQEQLVTYGSYVGTKSPPPYMAGACEVEVDRRTGRITVLKYCAAVDCGVAINPNLARIQVEGALVQGIGMALYEKVHRTDAGHLITNSFLTYHVPTRMEIGALEVHLVESYEPSGPFGAKSVGEIGIDTPPAAIANAVFNATGQRLTSVPLGACSVVR